MRIKTVIRGSLARGGLALWLALAPLLAGAQTTYTPDPEDAAFTKALNPIFGDVFGAGSGGGALDGAVGELFGNLNAAILLIAAIVTAYTMVAGTMATAHDGSMLGKKWSSMWIPIRTAFGIGMIIPLSGGWCAAQLAIFWLVGQSTALASNGWKAYADAYLTPTEVISAPMATNAPLLARNMFKALVCVEDMNRQADGGGSAGYAITSAGITGSITVDGGVRNYGTPGDPTYCGSIPYSGVTTTNEATRPIAQKVAEAHVSAFATLEATLRPMAHDAVTKPSGTVNNSAAFRGAIKTYVDTVETAAKSATAEGSEYSDRMKQLNGKGFIYAGFRQIELYASSKTLTTAVTAGPSTTDSTGGVDGTAVGMDNAGAQVKADKSIFEQAAATANSAWTSAKSFAVDGVNSVIGFLTEGYRIAMKMKDGEMSFTSMVNKASFAVTQGVVNDFKAGGSNPYTSGMNLGHKIMWTVEPIVTLIAILSMTGGALSSFVVSLWTSPAGIILTGLLGASYTSGVALTLIPLVPLAFWLAFIGGWLLMVAEAVIAAPLWMVAHLSPDAEGFTGRGSNGYLLITGVLLRPILGLIGLALSFSIGTVLCNLLDEAYVPMLQASAGDNLIGLGSIVAMIVAYVGLKYTILVQSFRTINVLADSVMRWIGGGEGHGGAVSAAQAVAAGAEGHHATMTGAVVGGISSLPGALRKSGGGNGTSGDRSDHPHQQERTGSQAEPGGDGGGRAGGDSGSSA